MQQPKVALIVDWLTVYAGAERVVEQIINIYPECDLFSLVDFLPDNQRGFLQHKLAKTTFIQRLPFSRKKFRAYLPFMPMAIETLNLEGYDIVISSSHAVARGAITLANQLHITYLQARNLKYAYEDRFLYFKLRKLGYLKEYLLHKLRMWDRIACSRPDHTIANSKYVSLWTKKVNRIKSQVIYPPVDVDRLIEMSVENKEEYYITVGRLEPYKRFDLIVDAFNQCGKPLYIVGDGSLLKKLKKAAKKSIVFLGFQSKEKVAELIAAAKALVFSGCEDFGISLVEAQACGTPVIAYGKGGALETVTPLTEKEPTGVLFFDQTVKEILNAVTAFENSKDAFTLEACKRNAKRFSNERFRREFKSFVTEKYQAHCNSLAQNYSVLSTSLYKQGISS
ncbi:glycosyltransferase [Piscirickettsia litoralis]|uniref:Glycosyl transferase family 1 n=1 Tax=Piscirickettsia litoralis TaxID=1891921 RepID=A0ABX3A5P2_9GAMM|nr:glycosyltransferase [Piscirickettsia litoralis]ODN42968.1 hypothetical protein BGC07_08595 [Piscirickettsia litoralis]